MPFKIDTCNYVSFISRRHMVNNAINSFIQNMSIRKQNACAARIIWYIIYSDKFVVQKRLDYELLHRLIITSITTLFRLSKYSCCERKQFLYFYHQPLRMNNMLNDGLIYSTDETGNIQMATIKHGAVSNGIVFATDSAVMDGTGDKSLLSVTIQEAFPTVRLHTSPAGKR